MLNLHHHSKISRYSHQNETTTTTKSTTDVNNTMDARNQNDAIQASIFIWSIIVMAMLVGFCITCVCYVICATREQLHNRGENEDNDLDSQEERRMVILSNVIHKKVTKRDENDDISLPHEKVIAKRKQKDTIDTLQRGNSFLRIHNSSNSNLLVESDEQMKTSINGKEPQQLQTRKQQQHDDINNKSMRSIRQSMNIKTESSLSIYSPTTCPICLEPYQTGDEIAWSSNKECPHAFHLDCIIKWLMDNTKCPMCRSKYLNLTNRRDEEEDSFDAL